ncbi:helix-turn-helix domain-containing protein [Lacticaseibacillus casei]|uniref:TetR/AcrR family transcriptional regulator n=1 Tax=Lacticaseibacillus TaxID=2759736 RepID=UPI0006673691|nr:MULTISPECIES: helix-turn-helix domain-containing protein [Lacticaseibacillus]QVI36375.1 helix-turn-helix domain-containing protein [Lacticaseibacillus casei]WFB42104.1 helix-turn-helix domain-containing protein [Lacticaseibacillus huelsenbergensis]
MIKYKDTEKRIWQAFFQLLEVEKFEKITINEICKQSKISRTTFYRHYVDKYRLLSTINHYFSTSLGYFLKHRVHQENITASLVDIAKFLSVNSEVVLVLLTIHTPESDLQELFKKVLHIEFADYVTRQHKSSVFPSNYLIEIYVAISMVFLSYSLRNGLDVDVIRSIDDIQKHIFATL